MPPQMADYRRKARQRMKAGLHPDVVAATQRGLLSPVTNQPEVGLGTKVNKTTGPRAGQSYSDVMRGGKEYHVYDNKIVGVKPRSDSAVLGDFQSYARKATAPAVQQRNSETLHRLAQQQAQRLVDNPPNQDSMIHRAVKNARRRRAA